MAVKRLRLVWYLIHNNSLDAANPETGFSSASPAHTCRKSGERSFIKQFWLWSTVKKCYRIYFPRLLLPLGSGTSRRWNIFLMVKQINKLIRNMNVDRRREIILLIKRLTLWGSRFQLLSVLETFLPVIQSPGVLTIWLIRISHFSPLDSIENWLIWLLYWKFAS